MSNKGQASLEVMTTYGWAILIAIIAIGSLVFFFDTDTFVSDTCYISDSFSCESYALTANTLLLKVKNLVGNAATISALQCEYEETEYQNDYTIVIGAGDSVDINCSMANLPEHKKLRIPFSVVYKEAGLGFDSYADGYIILAHKPS